MEFEKLEGEGAASGWMRYYGNGRRLAKRTAANELRIIVIDAAVVPEQARREAKRKAAHLEGCIIF